jgi:hypothetical protein
VFSVLFRVLYHATDKLSESELNRIREEQNMVEAANVARGDSRSDLS